MASKAVEKVKAAMAGGLDLEQFAASCRNLELACGVKIEPREAAEKLEVSEVRELTAFSRRITKRPEGSGDEFPPGPTFPERAAATTFVEGLREIAVRGHAQAETKERLIEYVSTSGRVPSAAELDVLQSGNAGTLADLTPQLEQARATADAGTWRISGHTTRYMNIGALGESDVARLEELIGRGTGDPDLFARRREAERMRAKIQELAARVKPAPPAKQRLEQPGAVVVPPIVLQMLVDGEILAPDLAFLVIMLLIWENRVLPFEQGSWFSDDGEICFRINQSFVPADWDPRGRMSLSGGVGSGSLANLEHATLIAVARDNGEVRIAKGPLLVEWDKKSEAAA